MSIDRPRYDVFAAIDVLFPGIVTQSTLWQAAYNRYIAKANPLDSSDVAGILAAANVLNAAQVLSARLLRVSAQIDF